MDSRDRSSPGVHSHLDSDGFVGRATNVPSFSAVPSSGSFGSGGIGPITPLRVDRSDDEDAHGANGARTANRSSGGSCALHTLLEPDDEDG